MSWVKLDDGFSEHAKVLRAGADGLALWVCGLAYCNRQPARDGFIPTEKVALLYPVSRPKQATARLVEVGLWEAVPGGFRVHDYHDFQPASDDLRAQRREAGSRGGLRSGEVRRSKIEANHEANGKQTGSNLLRESKQTDEANAKPVPVPVPVPDKNAERECERPTRSVPDTRAPESALNTRPASVLIGNLEATPFPDALTELTADMRRRITEPPIRCQAPDAEFAAWRAAMRAKRGKYSHDWQGLEWDAWVARHARFGCAGEAQLREAGRVRPRSDQTTGRVSRDDRADARALKRLVGEFDPAELEKQHG